MKSDECNVSVRINAADLAERVSKLITRLGVNASVSSGYRTQKANSGANGATRSAHMTGEAVDLVDKDGSLARMITERLLEEFNLYMENPQFTKGWVHLQIRKTRSGKRVFNP
jgi:hypothetical protein